MTKRVTYRDGNGGPRALTPQLHKDRYNMWRRYYLKHIRRSRHQTMPIGQVEAFWEWIHGFHTFMRAPRAAKRTNDS